MQKQSRCLAADQQQNYQIGKGQGPGKRLQGAEETGSFRAKERVHLDNFIIRFKEVYNRSHFIYIRDEKIKGIDKLRKKKLIF